MCASKFKALRSLYNSVRICVTCGPISDMMKADGNTLKGVIIGAGPAQMAVKASGGRPVEEVIGLAGYEYEYSEEHVSF